MVCPFILPEDRTHEFYQDLPSVLQSIQLELQSHGMDLLYHHHDFELEPYSDDENVLEYLLRTVDGLKLELDVYWIQKKAGKIRLRGSISIKTNLHLFT